MKKGFTNKKLKPDEYYNKIYSSMITSPCWKHVSGDAIKIYGLCLVEEGKAGRDNDFYLTYNTIEKYTGINRHYIKKRINELIDYGFIELVFLGGRKKVGYEWEKSRYKISSRWKMCTDDSKFKVGVRFDYESAKKGIVNI